MSYDKVFAHRRLVYHRILENVIQDTLRFKRSLSLSPYFRAACAEGFEARAMTSIDAVLSSTDARTVQTRCLSNMADLLSVWAGPKGGLRNGPGNNPSWNAVFELLLEENIKPGILALSNERSKWLCRPNHLTRLARHYERAVQILIQKSVESAKQFIQCTQNPMPNFKQEFSAECAARIDLQGGWSDTPPICYELGGSVLNIAVLVDGKRPIGARAKRIVEPCLTLKVGAGEKSYKIVIRSIQDVLNYDQPSSPGALLKACIVSADFLDFHSELALSEQLLQKFAGGIEIHSWSLLPQGCGMGTSSILAAAILNVLCRISGRSCDASSLVHAVLYVEQLLTTGGGWQDQVAGIYGGINRGYSKAGLPLQVFNEKSLVSEALIDTYNRHFLLIYTGKVRLAKNLLQNVIRNWYAKEKNTVECFEDLIVNSLEMQNAILKGDLSKIGLLMNKYWQQKKFLAPGCEPASVKNIMTLLEPLCYGQSLAGAGGGGYLIILTKEPNAKTLVEEKLSSLPENQKLSVHTVTVDTVGLLEI